MKIERTFTGTANLEDILLSILSTQIDSITAKMYDEVRANAIPSNTEGAANNL
ncbi:hypothetical protein [Paenibacillus xerothermodurans]|uniref:hypothetical protein n=1 Tax=Paenibacillus xerothermodurans TaxID=1977292 RepID=UPI001403EBF3|nr:hypothetical protein [Paenibacillus xerothermodurans]